MVQVPQKLHIATARKGSPDDVVQLATIQRSPSVVKVPVQLRLPADLAREFKVFCAERDLELSEAFVLMFEQYRRTVGTGG